MLDIDPATESKEIRYVDYAVMNTKSCSTKTTKIRIHVLRQPVLPLSFISKPPAVVMATGLPAAKEKALFQFDLEMSLKHTY